MLSILSPPPPLSHSRIFSLFLFGKISRVLLFLFAGTSENASLANGPGQVLGNYTDPRQMCGIAKLFLGINFLEGNVTPYVGSKFVFLSLSLSRVCPSSPPFYIISPSKFPILFTINVADKKKLKAHLKVTF